MNTPGEEPRTVRLGSPRPPWLLSERAVQDWAEAAAVCLEACGHVSGVTMALVGFITADRVRVEAPTVTDAMRRTHVNLKPAVEDGALAVVASLIHDLTEELFLMQADDHSGIDYWLCSRGQGFLFQDRARLEISGILREDGANSVERRMSEKSARLDKYDDEEPASIAIVEFSAPKAVMEDYRHG